MEIDVKGHSGCTIQVVRENDGLFVYKSTGNPGYFNRLELQAIKQLNAAEQQHRHIKIPKIHEIIRSDDSVTIRMDYVYSNNFVEFFDQVGAEQIYSLIDALIAFIEKEIDESPLKIVPSSIIRDKFKDVSAKTLANTFLMDDAEVGEILKASGHVFEALVDMKMPVGLCHGDLTFSNILFSGNNYYLIDFLDSFIESPLLDIVKVRQDTAWLWSRMMYVNPIDIIRLKIVMSKIDNEIDNYFGSRYGWYREYYHPLQLMNFLRILQYAHDPAVIEYLKITVNEQLSNF